MSAHSVTNEIDPLSLRQNKLGLLEIGSINEQSLKDIPTRPPGTKMPS